MMTSVLKQWIRVYKISQYVWLELSGDVSIFIIYLPVSANNTVCLVLMAAQFGKLAALSIKGLFERHK